MADEERRQVEGNVRGFLNRLEIGEGSPFGSRHITRLDEDRFTDGDSAFTLEEAVDHLYMSGRREFGFDPLDDDDVFVPRAGDADCEYFTE